MDILAIIGTITGIVTLLVLVGGRFCWWGRLSSRVDNLDREVQSLREDVNSLRDEFKGDINSLRDEILGEIRRSEQRILTALAHHSHIAPEAGRPVFWFPPGTEAAAPNTPDETLVEA